MYNRLVALAQQSGSTLDQILDATDLMLGKFGFKKTTMEDIAVKAGVSRRTVYEYFPSKRELILASIDRVVKKAQVQMTEDAATDNAPPEKLYRMLCSRVMVRVKSVQDITRSLDSMFVEIRADYLQKRHEYFQVEAKMIAAVVREGQEKGAFGTTDPFDTAALLVRATNAYLPYSLSVEELGHPDAIQADVEKLATILVSGISR